jgi:hypothetical protein
MKIDILPETAVASCKHAVGRVYHSNASGLYWLVIKLPGLQYTMVDLHDGCADSCITDSLEELDQKYPNDIFVSNAHLAF